MTALRRFNAALLIATVSLATAPASGAGDNESCDTAADRQAVDALRIRLRSEKLYDSWTKERCLGFFPEHCDASTVEVSIRELHSDACGGDPNTIPVVDRFRVHKGSSRIDWYSILDDEYLEFSKVHSVGKR